jgi:hypothetical protein
MRVRRGTGGREGELVQRAAELRKSVDPLLPRLAGDAPVERFAKLRAELEAVRDQRDEEKALARLGGGWREPLVRALAGLLRFYLDPSTPVVGVAPLPGGDVSFAVLNGSAREAQIAVQLGADRRRLLLGYLAWARRGLHFFATADTLTCTGHSSVPPADFRTGQLRELPYRLQPTADGTGFDCAHLRAGEHRPYLGVHWAGAETTFRLCQRCARDDRQLLAALTSGVAGPDPEREFSILASLNVTCRDGDRCLHARLPDLPRSLRKGYFYGRLSDAALLREYLPTLTDRLERSAAPLYVAAGTCFGSDRSAFLDALRPSAEERRALEGILPLVPGLFEIDEAAASRALEKLWPAHADDIVAAIVPDPERAQRLVREAKAHPGRVSDLLRRAARGTREQELLDALPQYAELAREAAFVDGIARAFRTHGRAEAVKHLVQHLPPAGKERGLGYGLLLALGQAGAHRWQFTETEQQFGETLAPAAEHLLSAPAAGYHDALEALLGRAGVANWGVRTPADESI